MAEKPPDEQPEKNPLDSIEDSTLGSFIKNILKVKSLKVNVDFPNFSLEIKTKVAPPPGQDLPSK